MGREETEAPDVPKGIHRHGGDRQQGDHDEQKNNFQAHAAIASQFS
jgi:hypothetical protein